MCLVQRKWAWMSWRSGWRESECCASSFLLHFMEIWNLEFFSVFISLLSDSGGEIDGEERGDMVIAGILDAGWLGRL